MEFDYCIYHRKCIDGISSAWIVKNYFPNINIIECSAGENLSENIELESLYQKNIIFLDICPPSKEELLEISTLGKAIMIIDHHITTKETIDSFIKESNIKNIKLIFDESKSGCQLTWEHFCPKESIPWFLNYIADRDLWKITMPYSKEINASLYEYRFTRSFESLDHLYKIRDEKELEDFKESLIKNGKIIMENRNSMIQNSLRNSIRCTYKNYNVWLYVCPKNILSEVGSKLTRWKFRDGSYPDFVVYWEYDVESHKFLISFRSAKNTVDVHNIARELNEKGGGHRNASGCVLEGGTELRKIFIPYDNDI